MTWNIISQHPINSNFFKKNSYNLEKYRTKEIIVQREKVWQVGDQDPPATEAQHPGIRNPQLLICGRIS